MRNHAEAQQLKVILSGPLIGKSYRRPCTSRCQVSVCECPELLVECWVQQLCANLGSAHGGCTWMVFRGMPILQENDRSQTSKSQIMSQIQKTIINHENSPSLTALRVNHFGGPQPSPMGNHQLWVDKTPVLNSWISCDSLVKHRPWQQDYTPSHQL